ncbi:putative oxidoreductase-like protein [Aneurinibacillus soli]|uniref:Thioredoxin reductase n=1 Tax=Aneurinibacillus soli TaxID=1500254 RepID=A0A0U5BC33_9BACL|nr:FAD-dependent oxidoreductase [Aneurinibacillus soli]PYE64336.1 putative oxidoreductase-like protein [Aneurinibacillus soli]BAU28285.1 Thioredoxin reductase [Aneurinibacillus soli]
MYDILVIGAGPAGASAALIAAKSGKKTLLLDSNQSITKKAWIENHYGVREITGPALVELGQEQAKKFGAELVQTKVENIEKASEGLRVDTENGSFEARHVILATGLFTDLAEKIGVQTKSGTEPRVKTIVDVDALGKTSVEGIWAAGGIAGKSLHTIIVAGDGANVAINIISELNGERYVDHDVLK